MKFLKRFDFLGPQVNIFHEGETFEDSILSLVISIICTILIIIAIIYFSRTIIWRKSPATDIYEVYVYEEGSYLINNKYFSHFITLFNYQKFNFEFDYKSYRIIGMQYNLNTYLNFFGGDISLLDHWVYGPCDANKDFNNIDNKYVQGIINSSACIMKYYDSKEKKYCDRDDNNFKLTIINYGKVNSENKIYSIVVEKCKEDTLNLILGGSHQCVSDSELNESLLYGNSIQLFFADNYVNLLDYDNPSNSYFNSMENSIENNFLSTNILSFKPFTMKSNKGYIFNRYDRKKLYEFDRNDVSTLPKHPGEEDVYMNYNIKLNNIMKNYERRYSKLQDVFAEIGGFIEIICFIAGFILKYYNEYIVLKNTKQIISHLYVGNGPLSNIPIDNTNKDLNNINNKIFNDIENNQSIIQLQHNTNLNNDKNKSDVLKVNDNPSNISTKENDNQSVFNEENQNFCYFSYLIHRITFDNAFKKYNIYKEFRGKIFNDEQFIKNHIILYNLNNKNKENSKIYSLKEIINDEK